MLPFALLKPKKVEARTHLYKCYPNPIPLSPKNQELLLQLLPFLTPQSPVVIDLETEGLQMAGTAGMRRRVAAVSLSNHQGVSSWNCQGDVGQRVWKQILSILRRNKVPLIAHNLSFDYAWALRDLNVDDTGRLPQWQNDFKKLNIRYCTLGLFMQLASEGFPGQSHSLAYAQKNLLLWEADNKGVRDKKLVESLLLKKRIPREIGEKLFGGKDEYDRYLATVAIQDETIEKVAGEEGDNSE